jgi:lactoylglutathione lyase
VACLQTPDIETMSARGGTSPAATRKALAMTPPKELRLVLTLDDLDGAVGLFRDALQLEQVAELRNDGGRGVLLDAGHATLELFDPLQAAAVDQVEVGRRVAGQVRIAFSSDDSGEAAQRLLGAGAELVAGPVVTPWGDRNVRLEGPESLQLTLFTPISRSNKELAEDLLVNVVGNGQLERLGELVAEDCVDHGMESGFVEHVRWIRGVFPDMAIEVNDLVAEGDRVVAYWALTGTHRGEWGGVPATGRKVTGTAISKLRFRDGKLAEYEVQPDVFGVLVQLGAVTPPGAG